MAERRSFGYQQNKAAKVIVCIAMTVMAVYLMGAAVGLALIANDSRHFTSIEIMCLCAPFIFALDFVMRFSVQQTPAQIIKPYLLLPLPRRTCINSIIANSLLGWGNTVWLILVVPFCIMSVLFSYGLWQCILLTAYFWILAMINSQWYAITGTLLNDSIAWIALPVVVYGLTLLPPFFLDDIYSDYFIKLYELPGTEMGRGSILPIATALALLAIVATINRNIQDSHMMEEVRADEKKTQHSSRKLSFLDRLGDTGQYIKLELRLISRNKNPRKLFIFSTLIVVGITVIICTSDIYDSDFMTKFWCIYNLVVYGDMLLVRIMCYEGNYIDCLMVRRENLLSMLKAKYAVYCAMLAVPFLLMLPLVITGKWPLLMLVSLTVFTSGCQYFLLFQLAVYNKQSVALNTKLISKNGGENSYAQIVVEIASFALPMVFVSMMETFLSEDMAYTTLLILGIAFTATHRIWLRNVYKRFMSRRYANIDALRGSRQ